MAGFANDTDRDAYSKETKSPIGRLASLAVDGFTQSAEPTKFLAGWGLAGLEIGFYWMKEKKEAQRKSIGQRARFKNKHEDLIGTRMCEFNLRLSNNG